MLKNVSFYVCYTIKKLFSNCWIFMPLPFFKIINNTIHFPIVSLGWIPQNYNISQRFDYV